MAIGWQYLNNFMLQNDLNILCPICNSDSVFLYKVTRELLIKKLEEYYQDGCSKNLSIIDYDILQCKNCLLQFTNPLEPGHNNYYEWVAKHSGYYPTTRWEWNIVLNAIKEVSVVAPVNLLEVGCGNGSFLDRVHAIVNSKLIGLDTTRSSVAICKGKGLEVYCETISNYILTSNKASSFDFVVAFHCLEHLANPKEFVTAMRALLKPSGRLYLSTPYSPMSFEPAWFDPMNHPPHHLTRWNETSYRELARQLNLNIVFYMPDAANIIDRALYTLNLLWNGPMGLSSNIGIKIFALIHPFATIKEIIRQNKRFKVNNKVAANVVLVEMSRVNN